MRSALAVLAVLGLLGAGARAERREITLSGGWLGGVGGGVSITASGLQASRFGVRFGVNVTLTDAFKDGASFGAGSFGEYKAARGLSELGVNTAFGVDLLYALGSFGPLKASAYLGGRANVLNASYGAGDEISKVASGQLGLGGGVLLGYALGRGVSVVGDVGAERYFAAPISGYAGGEGSVVSPGSADYAAVDAFVRRPEVVFRLKLGLDFSF